jgi:hypothetical protein
MAFYSVVNLIVESLARALVLFKRERFSRNLLAISQQWLCRFGTASKPAGSSAVFLDHLTLVCKRTDSIGGNAQSVHTRESSSCTDALLRLMAISVQFPLEYNHE